MYYLSLEFKYRGYSGLQWKRYHRILDVTSNSVEIDWITPKLTGLQLTASPLKFFPQYCSDIMDVIEELTSTVNVPDSLKKYQTRIFANFTVINGLMYDNYNYFYPFPMLFLLPGEHFQGSCYLPPRNLHNYLTHMSLFLLF